MGYSYDKEAGPKMCFNAAKLWQLGWNSNRHLSLSSSEPFYIGDLAGFVDDPDTPGSPMIIKIDDPSGEDYFINFNVKADFNSGTKEGGDEVLVIRAGDGVGYAESQLKAKLGEGSSYTVFDFDDGKDLLVQVLSINTQSRIANIRVCIGECPPDCTSNAQCDDSDACTMDSCVEGVCSNSPRLESELCGACPAGERVLDIRVLTDRYPQETSWTLRNKCTDTIQVLEAQNSDFTESATEYGTGQICVPKGEYEFTINDAYGDGICCNYGQGSFSIAYNGIAVSLVEESDFAFKSSKTIEFGEVCSQNDEFDLATPTASPSESPTAHPTRSPTKLPSRAPSSNPSKAPTGKPSRSPTKLPSRTPSSNMSPNVGGACPAGERVLDIRVLTDRYPQETSWTLRNKCTDTIQVLEAQNSDFTESATEYGTGQICVPKGEYEFTINDAYGDGICCNYGQGSFSIAYNGIAVSLVEESDFAFKSSRTIEFGEVCSQNIIPRCVDIDRSGTTFCQGVADDISQCSQARGDDPSQMISSLCPITCGVECTKCYDVESYQHKKITKDCDWAKRNNKCTKSKFMAWCPKMCGVCQ